MNASSNSNSKTMNANIHKHCLHTDLTKIHTYTTIRLINTLLFNLNPDCILLTHFDSSSQKMRNQEYETAADNVRYSMPVIELYIWTALTHTKLVSHFIHISSCLQQYLDHSSMTMYSCTIQWCLLHERNDIHNTPASTLAPLLVHCT